MDQFFAIIADVVVVVAMTAAHTRQSRPTAASAAVPPPPLPSPSCWRQKAAVVAVFHLPRFPTAFPSPLLPPPQSAQSMRCGHHPHSRCHFRIGVRKTRARRHVQLGPGDRGGQERPEGLAFLSSQAVLCPRAECRPEFPAFHAVLTSPVVQPGPGRLVGVDPSPDLLEVLARPAIPKARERPLARMVQPGQHAPAFLGPRAGLCPLGVLEPHARLAGRGCIDRGSLHCCWIAPKFAAAVRRMQQIPSWESAGRACPLRLDCPVGQGGRGLHCVRVCPTVQEHSRRCPPHPRLELPAAFARLPRVVASVDFLFFLLVAMKKGRRDGMLNGVGRGWTAVGQWRIRIVACSAPFVPKSRWASSTTGS